MSETCKHGIDLRGECEDCNWRLHAGRLQAALDLMGAERDSWMTRAKSSAALRDINAAVLGRCSTRAEKAEAELAWVMSQRDETCKILTNRVDALAESDRRAVRAERERDEEREAHGIAIRNANEAAAERDSALAELSRVMAERDSRANLSPEGLRTLIVAHDLLKAERDDALAALTRRKSSMACSKCDQLGCSFPCMMRQRDDALAALAEMRKVLESIADDPHCTPDMHSPSRARDDQYRVGVADGHRCAAQKARYALEKEGCG